MEVTLAEEIQCTVCYIDILKARFPDNFNIRWQFNEPLPEIKVPKLLFQPLIENSITHGAGSFRKAISIDIRIEEFSGYTGITLTDDGQGILPSRLEEIRRQMSQADSADTKHVGLFNLYKRLRLFYSGGCSLTINSKPSEGTTTVSYTHLDVYKRQSLTFFFFIISLLFTTPRLYKIPTRKMT